MRNSGKRFSYPMCSSLPMSIPPAKKQIQGVSGELIANAAKGYGHKNVHYVQDKQQVPAVLMNIVKKGDIVITMGAGISGSMGKSI